MVREVLWPCVAVVAHHTVSPVSVLVLPGTNGESAQDQPREQPFSAGGVGLASGSRTARQALLLPSISELRYEKMAGLT